MSACPLAVDDARGLLGILQGDAWTGGNLTHGIPARIQFATAPPGRQPMAWSFYDGYQAARSSTSRSRTGEGRQSVSPALYLPREAYTGGSRRARQPEDRVRERTAPCGFRLKDEPLPAYGIGWGIMGLIFRARPEATSALRSTCMRASRAAPARATLPS